MALPGPAPSESPQPVLPAAGQGGITGIVPALLRHLDGDGTASWLPAPVAAASQVVLLVLDGLGWDQLQANRADAPFLSAMTGGPITSVAPTTTSAALSSIATGRPPGEHGVIGYRVHVGSGAVMNVLRWRTPLGDARELVPPEWFQAVPAFGGRPVPAVIRSEFLGTAFTAAHLRGARLIGWRVPSTLVVEVGRELAAGSSFVYAYYDGVDRVAHEFGLGAHYRAELAATDRLVADVAATLPPGAVLLVTADHGQVDVGDAVIAIDADLMADTVLLSGEGRFRWLHAKPGTAQRLAERAHALYDDVAWVRTAEQLQAEGWFGPEVTPDAAERLGDVALVPFAPVAFIDPADTGDVTLVSRHGSLTSAEMLVPLLASGA